MKKIIFLFSVVFLAACSTPGSVEYKPYDQLTPQHIMKISVRPFINSTEVFALEDKLTLAVTDEFLRNGQFQIVNESQADGIIIGQISRYLMVPLQYDSQMIPTTYRLDVWLRVQLMDVKTGVSIWEEPALVGSYVYSASTRPGGMTEDQARDQVWQQLSVDIVKRTTAGFGSVWSQDRRKEQANSEFTTITR